MSKLVRHKAIKEIIKSVEVDSQDILLNMLIERGFELTQATLSRDIKELKIAKMPITGGYAYRLLESNMYEEEISTPTFKFISIDFSGQLAIAKTRSGYAMAFAAEIDKRASREILGTVAGDDTILLIPRENVSREQVLEALSIFIN